MLNQYVIGYTDLVCGKEVRVNAYWKKRLDLFASVSFSAVALPCESVTDPGPLDHDINTCNSVSGVCGRLTGASYDSGGTSTLVSFDLGRIEWHPYTPRTDLLHPLHCPSYPLH